MRIEHVAEAQVRKLAQSQPGPECHQHHRPVRRRIRLDCGVNPQLLDLETREGLGLAHARTTRSMPKKSEPGIDAPAGRPDNRRGERQYA